LDYLTILLKCTETLYHTFSIELLEIWDAVVKWHDNLDLDRYLTVDLDHAMGRAILI
jgi:hypothetical protein